MLPLIVVRVLINNRKNFVYSSGLGKFCTVMLFLDFTLIKMSIDISNDFWYMMFWQFLMVYPICFVSIYYLLKNENSEKTSKKSYVFLDGKQRIIIGIMTILSFSFIVTGINESNKKVYDTHNQLINDLLKSDNPTETLIYNSITPSTMLDILPHLEDIKEGEVEVLSLPWKSTVKVRTNKETGQFTREFTYVRFYRDWKLDGIYRRTGHYFQSN